MVVILQNGFNIKSAYAIYEGEIMQRIVVSEDNKHKSTNMKQLPKPNEENLEALTYFQEAYELAY